MWVLLMIIFSQPYQVEYINLLGSYKHKEECVIEKDRAVNTMNQTNSRPVSFGCLKIGLNKTSTKFHVKQYKGEL